MSVFRVPTAWVLAVAGGCAVVGVLLKVADLQRSKQIGQVAGGPASMAGTPARREPTAPPEQVAGLEPTGAEPGAPSDVPPAVADRPAALDTPRAVPPDAAFLPGSPRVARNRPGHERRQEQARARRTGGSLEVGEARSAAAPGLAAAGHDAHSAPGGAPAAPEAARTAPEPPPPPPAEPAFQSGDDTRYALDQPVEVPDIGKIVGRAGTLSFWLQPAWQEGNQDDASLLEVGDGRLQVLKNVNFLRFEFTDDTGVKGGLGAPITDWKAGEWHQVTTTWSGNQFSLYVDGQLVSQTLYPGQPMQLPADSKLVIGSEFPESRPIAPGVIGRVDVNGRPLGPGEVAQQFAKATGQPAKK